MQPLVTEARALRLPCPKSLFEARSLDDLRLRVQRFRLLGARGLEEEGEGEEEGMVSDVAFRVLTVGSLSSLLYIDLIPTPSPQHKKKHQKNSPAELLALQRARIKAKRDRKRAASLAPPHPPLAVPRDLRPGDRIGMGGGGGRSKGEGERYATHVVKVRARDFIEELRVCLHI